MAASVRFPSFLLLLVLLQAANSRSSTTAYPLQAVEITVAAARNVLEVAEGSSSANANKEISDAKAAQEVEKPWPGGRKMLLRSVLKKEATVKKDTLNGEDARISGAAHHRLVANCDDYREKGTMSGKCKLSSYKVLSNPMKDKRVGFSNLSSDYNIPKPHPPKHN